MSNCQRVLFCLSVFFICLLPDHSRAADQAETRKEIARLKSEVSERLKRISELETQLDFAHPRWGLEGYCPVTLVNDERWVIGSPDHRVTFEGCVYHFADAQRRQAFEQSPYLN